jgi:DeoR/GlpR family transcriptional regulator of sugar metabolism
VLAHERAEKIIERLREQGTVSAQELMRWLQVSAPTIRRDLERLEHEGVLRRVHGGAFLPHAPAPSESPFAEVVNDNAAGKDAVAARAAELVTPGQVVLLDIGTTTMRIARQLAGKHVTVITASLAVLDVLRHDDVVELVLLGGSVRRNFESLVGPLTQDALATVTADIAFLSCTGVRPDGSVVDDISQEAALKRAMVRCANRVVLAAPAGKFPGTGSLRICRLDEVDDLITTAGADESTLERCRQAGGSVVVLLCS